MKFKKDKDSNSFTMEVSNCYIQPFRSFDDICDCDQRCSKCGKKKKEYWTSPTITWMNTTTPDKPDCDC